MHAVKEVIGTGKQQQWKAEAPKQYKCTYIDSVRILLDELLLMTQS